MKPYLNAAMALFLLSAAPLAAQAAEPKIKVVRVIGDDIRVPIPDGFCEPEGPFQDNARLAEASDTQNVTFLALFSCADMAKGDVQHMIYIKGPKELLTTRASLKELLDAMGAVPESEMNKVLADDSISPGVEKDASKAFGQKVEMKTEIQPAAKDAYAYYLAGSVEADVGERHIVTAVGVAMTSVKGHVLSYNAYMPGKDVAAIRAALEQAKAETRKLLAAN